MTSKQPKTFPADTETSQSPQTRVGFVGLAGAPNVGKSTLVQSPGGAKGLHCFGTVPDHPRTGVRHYSDATMQAILVDIPGILDARDRFNMALMEWAEMGLAGCDLILHLRDARRPNDPADDPVRAMLAKAGKPTWQVWNKVDRMAGRLYPSACDPALYEKSFGLSAKTGRGVEPLLEALREALPAGPMLYDPEQICDRELRFLAAELVREKVFRYLGQEIPYATATYTEVFDENRGERSLSALSS